MVLIPRESTPSDKYREIYEEVGISKPTPSKKSVSGTIGEKTNPFYQRYSHRKYRSMGGQHSAPQADRNDREALADFETELQRMRYDFDVAF